jgi:hypothetical protein
MNFGLKEYIDLDLLPFIVSGLALLIYVFLYAKKIFKMQPGYYSVIFSTIRGVLLIPFWGFLILLTVYLYNPEFRNLIDYGKPEPEIHYKSLIIKNNLPEENLFLILNALPDSSIKDDKVVHSEIWRTAKPKGTETDVPTFSIPPFAEKEIFFESPPASKKIYLRLLSEKENEWKTAVPGRVLDMTGGKHYIFSKDLALEKNPEIKPTPRRSNLEYFLFYLLGFIGMAYHIIAVLTMKSKAKIAGIIILAIPAAGCGWMVYNYGVEIWFAFLG